MQLILPSAQILISLDLEQTRQSTLNESLVGVHVSGSCVALGVTNLPVNK